MPGLAWRAASSALPLKFKVPGMPQEPSNIRALQLGRSAKWEKVSAAFGFTSAVRQDAVGSVRLHIPGGTPLTYDTVVSRPCWPSSTCIVVALGVSKLMFQEGLLASFHSQQYHAISRAVSCTSYISHRVL